MKRGRSEWQNWLSSSEGNNRQTGWQKNKACFIAEETVRLCDGQMDGSIAVALLEFHTRHAMSPWAKGRERMEASGPAAACSPQHIELYGATATPERTQLHTSVLTVPLGSSFTKTSNLPHCPSLVAFISDEPCVLSAFNVAIDFP